jgi:hypothetical protein
LSVEQLGELSSLCLRASAFFFLQCGYQLLAIGDSWITGWVKGKGKVTFTFSFLVAVAIVSSCFILGILYGL